MKLTLVFNLWGFLLFTIAILAMLHLIEVIDKFIRFFLSIRQMKKLNGASKEMLLYAFSKMDGVNKKDIDKLKKILDK
jgi:hypothetical protein